MSTTTKIDLTWMSIIKVVVVLLGFYLLFRIIDILALIFIVFIIVSALNPMVLRLQKQMPRVIAVTIIYLIILILLALISLIVFQPLSRELGELAKILPNLISQYTPTLETWEKSSGDISSILQSTLQNFSDKISQLTGNIIQTVSSIFGGIVTALTILVMSFYLLLEEKGSKKTLEAILPANQHDRAYQVLGKFSEKMGAWVRGQLLLMVIVGVLDYIILTILGVKGSLALATWGGVTELIPYVGPIIGAIPAIIIAWSQGGFFLAFLVFILMLVLVQWLEGQIIVPNVMKKAVGLSPIIIIIALLIGGKLLNILGIILAVPVAALISVIVQEWETIVKIYNNRQ